MTEFTRYSRTIFLPPLAAIEVAVKAVTAHEGKGNIFVTLNPAKPALLARANNHLAEGSYKNPAERTKDTEIYRDSWFVLDIDPNRPSGVSSTADELRAATITAQLVRDWLLSVGGPESAILTGTSGNGTYILVRLPDYEITDQRIAAKKAFLNFIADKFDGPAVEIDRTVFNPARLVCALGTMKKKGENIEDRPHRRSKVFKIGGETFEPVKAQRCEPFDVYALAARILPPAESKTPRQSTGAKTPGAAGAAYNGFDARKIAHLLQNHKSTSNGFDRYDCPNCGRDQKMWINPADGKYGCFEPDSVCDWRKLHDKVRDLAVAAGLEVETQKSDANQSQQKASVNEALGKIVTARTLLETDYPEPQWAVKGLIPEGTTFMAGPPKLGKSIFALNIAVW